MKCPRLVQFELPAEDFTPPSLPPNQKRAAVSPTSFLSVVLPYSVANYTWESPFELIDPTCVISGTFDKYPSLSPSDALSRISALNAETMSKDGDPAWYAQVGTLPLYIALAGC